MLPRHWDRRTTVLLTFALLFFISTNLAHAQVFNLERSRVQMAELHGLWRFHTGDDPDGKLGWADPGFDDSEWKLVRPDHPLDIQGCPTYSGMAWYRFQVLLPASHPPLAIFIPEIGTSFQVYASGRLIGQYGGLPPHERVYFENPGASTGATHVLGHDFSIPATTTDNASLVIAIRIWNSPEFASFCDPLLDSFSIGSASLISELKQHRWNDEFWSLTAQSTLLLGSLLAALAGLGLFLLRRGEGEYLWFAAAEVLAAAGYFLNVYPVSFDASSVAGGVALSLQVTCLSIFYVTLLKEPKGWVFWSAIGAACFGFLMVPPGLAGMWSSSWRKNGTVSSNTLFPSPSRTSPTFWASFRFLPS
jgi:sigma-B regulation protein RsbU (phosphoserine phosphatase)